MAFDSFGEFLAMGNHGFYVWLSYGLTFVVMGGLAWVSVADHSAMRRSLRAQRRRAAAAQSAQTSHDARDRSAEQGAPQ